MRLHSFFLLTGLVIVSNVGCAPTPVTSTLPQAGAAATITLVKPEKRTVKRLIEQPGTIEPVEETVLYPKIAGYVSTIAMDPNKQVEKELHRLLDIGSKVSKDQLLAELSVPELDEEIKQKESVIKQLEAEMVQSRKASLASAAGVGAAQAKVTEAKAGLSRAYALFDRWNSEVERVKRLVSNGVIDAQTRDETLNQFKSAEATKFEAEAKVTSAEASVTKAQADFDKAQADVAATDARADVARADLRRVQALKNYTKIKAPFDGIITQRAANTGDFLTADGKHSVFTVARVDPVRVVIHIPEADSGLIQMGQSMQFTIQSMPGKPLTGKIARTSWSLVPGSRTLRVEADLSNPQQQLRPGMYVYAQVGMELPSAWSLPAAAVGKVNDEPVLYLAEGGKAVRVTAQLLRGDNQFTQVQAYRRGSSSFEITGNEQFAMPANALSDGQVLPGK